MTMGTNVPVDPTYMSESFFSAYREYRSANVTTEFEEDVNKGFALHPKHHIDIDAG